LLPIQEVKPTVLKMQSNLIADLLAGERSF